VNALGDARTQVRALRASIAGQTAGTRGARADSLRNFDRQLATLEGAGGGRGGRGGGGAGAAAAGGRGLVTISSLPLVQSELMTLYSVIEDSDAAPTTQVTAAVRSRLVLARTALAAVRRLGTVVERR
jgi:hypothetical protein